jgi:hypothetical protein
MTFNQRKKLDAGKDLASNSAIDIIKDLIKCK